MYARLRGSLGPPHIVGRSVCTMRGIHMHNMFQLGTDCWGGTWIRRTTPFREAWVLTPLMAFLIVVQAMMNDIYMQGSLGLNTC
jgi:hypothetical protein